MNDPIEKWERKFALTPHFCDATGEIIWLRYAYRGHTDPLRYDDIHFFESSRWLTPIEYTWMLLEA
jgi:hypothetical protein